MNSPHKIEALRGVINGAYSRQEVFDTIVTRLLAQGCSAVQETSENSIGVACTYRNEDGHGCAVGVLMNDNEIEYARKRGALTSSIWGLLDELNYAQYDDDDNSMTNFLVHCQVAHDESYMLTGDEWKAQIRSRYAALAEAYELNTEVLDAIAA